MTFRRLHIVVLFYIYCTRCYCFQNHFTSKSLLCGSNLVYYRSYAQRNNALLRFIGPNTSRKDSRLQALPVYDAGVSVVAIGASLIWLEIWTSLANNGKIDPKLSRKIIHCGSAPLFMCLWPLYSDDSYNKVLAAFVPFLNAARLFIAGIRSNDDMSSSSRRLAATISRSGSNKEALGGPLIYTIVLFLATIVFFRDSPTGVVAVCQMAAGDGLADIVGRRWGTAKWPFSVNKSYIGSLSFVIGGFLVSAGVLQLLSVSGSLNLDVVANLPQLLLVSIICAATELVPIGDDNVSVPLVGAIATALLIS